MERKAARKRQQQHEHHDNQQQSQRMLQYLTPAPVPSSSNEVIVLDDDAPPPSPSRPSLPHAPVRPVTAAEKEERRYDPRDDGSEGDTDLQSDADRNPSPPSASRRDRLGQSATARTAVSSRRGGFDHYAQIRSTRIDESSFTHAYPPVPMTDVRAARRSHPPSDHDAAPLLLAPAANAFAASAPSERAVLTSTEPPWRAKSSSASRPPSRQAGSVSRYFADVDDEVVEVKEDGRPIAPRVPVHRQQELYSAEEKQVWDMFDQAKRQRSSAPYGTSSSSSSSTRGTSAGDGGRPKRSVPVGLFDTPAVRLEEQIDRARKRKKKEHPLLEERRASKRLRAAAAHIPVPSSSSSSSSLRPPIPPLLPPSLSPRHSPVPHAPPKAARKTRLLVDPAVAAAEKQREERQTRAARERLTQQRLKPSLDELHATVLSWSPFQLDGAVKDGLQGKFLRVPLTFRDDVEYQHVFYPLLLEECRSEMLSALDELDGALEERAEDTARSARSIAQAAFFDPKGLLEVVQVAGYTLVNAFHHVDVERVEWSQSAKAPPLFTNDDLVLLWYRPSSADPFEPNEWKTASLYTLARLERVHDHPDDGKKAERRKRGVRYKLQVHAQHGGDGEVNAQKLLTFLLKTGNQWGVLKVISLITIHRQYRALESCALLSLFPWLKDPQALAQQRGERPAVDTAAVLRPYPAALTEPFNISQREAMATALDASDGITLIQGPPGSGKTKTIVGLINLLLVQGVSSSSTTQRPSSASSSTLRAVAGAPSARILICAPSNAAIDEIVARLLHPDALHDARGGPLKPRIVRVGAGKRNADKEAVKAHHDGLDVDSVSLDTLVAQRMKEREPSDSVATDPRASSKKADANKKDATFYDQALAAVKEQLDDVHARINNLEEQKHALVDPVIHLDADGSAERKAEPAAADGDVHVALETAHRQRKAYLAERKRLHEKKDEFYQQQRRAQQKAIDNRDGLRLSILNAAHLVCTTLTGAGLELFTQSAAAFDCVIIDEAAQAIEIQTLIPMKYDCQRYVLVGDDRQLSATVISTLATRYDYQQSLFSRLRKCGVQVQVIQIQYRMHPEVRAFPSRFFYEDRLRDAPEVLRSDVVQRHIGLLHPLPSVPLSDNRVDRRLAPYVLYNVKGVERRAGHASLHNVAEARVAVEVFRLILRGYQRAHPGPFHAAEFMSRVGVITPYQQQVSTLRRLFRELLQSDPVLSPYVGALEVSTVDSFQGREKEFVIFSAVRAHQHEQAGAGIGFVADANRLNVALTRARQCLFLLGSVGTLGKEEIWRALIEDARRRDCQIDVGDDVQAVFRDPLHHTHWLKELTPSSWGGALTGQRDDEMEWQWTVDGGAAHVTSPVLSHRKPRRSLSGAHTPTAASESPTPRSPVRRPSATARRGGAEDEGKEKAVRPASVGRQAAAPAKKTTKMLPPPTTSHGSPAPPTSSSSVTRAQPPRSAALTDKSKPVKTLKQQPIADERKDGSSPSSAPDKPASKPASPRSSVRNIDLNSLMQSSANPLSGARGYDTDALTAVTGAAASTKQTPPSKPRRTLSSTPSSLSSSPPALEAAATPSSAASPRAEPPSSKPSSTRTARPAPTGPLTIRSSSLASPPPASPPLIGKRRRRTPGRDEIDVTASASFSSQDDLVITSAHVVPPPPPQRAELEDGELPPTPPSPAVPYLQTERGAVRATLPAYSCEECRDFHRLMDRGARDGDGEGGRSGRYRPQEFEMACNHRMRHVPPATPPDYWNLNTPPDPRPASQRSR